MVGVVILQAGGVAGHPAGVGVQEAGRVVAVTNAGVGRVIVRGGQDVAVVLLEVDLLPGLVLVWRSWWWWCGSQPGTSTSLQLITSHSLFVFTPHSSLSDQ